MPSGERFQVAPGRTRRRLRMVPAVRERACIHAPLRGICVGASIDCTRSSPASWHWMSSRNTYLFWQPSARSREDPVLGSRWVGRVRQAPERGTYAIPFGEGNEVQGRVLGTCHREQGGRSLTGSPQAKMLRRLVWRSRIRRYAAGWGNAELLVPLYED